MSWRINEGGGSGAGSDVLSKLRYDKPTDTIIADASFQTKPSTVYLGSAFGMSNGVQAVGFRLADGTEALGIVNRFDKIGGTYSNPKFFALGQSSMLNVQLDASTVMSDPVEVNYTTAGDNLTYMFEIIPASAGRLRAQYWLGDSDSGAPVVDFHYDVTDEQVDLGAPIQVTPNFYVLPSGSPLFVRFSGVDLKGNGVTPYFRSQILPYKEVTINGHVENVTSNQTLYIGCDYAVATSGGAVTLTVPLTFKDKFRVYDHERTFTTVNKCIVDFTAFGQGTFEMIHRGDDCEFFYVDGRWYVNDIKGNQLGRVG